eukprot:CAMPEP_0119315092 /NCGR_PEP_ID=MMETSP1333-20130426/34428_1 /TAXON_ID=418940 /ORGANISM="Scyphosphaera apsteinii, Strain RCC1455" /LENGTH=142 /DNA_ID=CAMNT_0007320331 /DNA_START=90 /DNA_END=518 /DNA_ORIENTATION=+
MPSLLSLLIYCYWKCLPTLFCKFVAAISVVATLVVIKEFWEDEESISVNGVLIGSPGVLRVRLHRYAETPITAYATSLEGLITQANAQWKMPTIDRICTAFGSTLRTLTTGGGLTCIADESRCIFDGTDLYAVARGDDCVPV